MRTVLADMKIFIIATITLQSVPIGSITVEQRGTTNGYYIEVLSNTVNQATAMQVCGESGGWLSEPKNKSISDGIKSILNGLAAYYYSGLKKDNAGDWRWKDGDLVTWTNWDGGDSPTESGNCMYHGGGMAWFNNDCSEVLRYLCQYNGYCDVHPHPCQNNGVCISNHTHAPYYKCNCTEGYYNDICEEQRCEPPCQNEETCSFDATTSVYECDCRSGFFGDNCADEYCDAHPNTCKNGGTCISNNYSSPYYNCRCVEGYYGNTCDVGYCIAHANPCENGGMCTSRHGDSPFYNCICTPGFYGNKCSEKYCDAHPNPCKRGGTCSSTTIDSPYYECSCVAGYYGSTCNSSITANGSDLGYYFETTWEKHNQSVAKQVCEERGGWLVEPKSQSVSVAIENIFKSWSAYFFSGLKKNVTEVWIWKDYEDINSFQNWNWKYGEPGGSIGGAGDCMALGEGMKWHDWECERKEYFLCQFRFCDAYKNICKNDGVCIADYDIYPYYKCNCIAGYSGELCELEQQKSKLWIIWASLVPTLVIFVIFVVVFYLKRRHSSETIADARNDTGNDFTSKDFKLRELTGGYQNFELPSAKDGNIYDKIGDPVYENGT